MLHASGVDFTLDQDGLEIVTLFENQKAVIKGQELALLTEMLLDWKRKDYERNIKIWEDAKRSVNQYER